MTAAHPTGDVATAVAWTEVAPLVRQRSFEDLERRFAEGVTPQVPAGSYVGLLVTCINRPVDLLVRLVQRIYTPWLGKYIDLESGRGANLFPRPNHLLYRVLMPRVPFRRVGDLMAGIELRYECAGSVEPGPCDVLAVEYHPSDTNPKWTHRIRDEVVDVGDGVLLGRMLVRTRKGMRQTAWFLLQRQA